MYTFFKAYLAPGNLVFGNSFLIFRRLLEVLHVEWRTPKPRSIVASRCIPHKAGLPRNLVLRQTVPYFNANILNIYLLKYTLLKHTRAPFNPDGITMKVLTVQIQFYCFQTLDLNNGRKFDVPVTS